jgi:general secretion pathway protein I
MMQSSEFGFPPIETFEGRLRSELKTKHPHPAKITLSLIPSREIKPPHLLSSPSEGRGSEGEGESPLEGAGVRGIIDRIPHSNGFTLLEVMVAVAILGFVLVSLLGLASRSEQDVMLAERITTASLLAKRKMTETLSTKIDLAEEEGAFEEEEFKDYTWKKIISPTPVEKLLEVRIAVLWKEGQRQEMVELVSYE